MDFLGSRADTMFLGQAVAYKGTAMTNTLKDFDPSKLLEMPVDEEMQMGITNGLAVAGTVPISIYPRWNFLLLTMNQLINHLDRMPAFSHGEYVPKVIVRTGIGSERPLHPQAQHVGDSWNVQFHIGGLLEANLVGAARHVFLPSGPGAALDGGHEADEEH